MAQLDLNSIQTIAAFFTYNIGNPRLGDVYYSIIINISDIEFTLQGEFNFRNAREMLTVITYK